MRHATTHCMRCIFSVWFLLWIFASSVCLVVLWMFACVFMSSFSHCTWDLLYAWINKEDRFCLFVCFFMRDPLAGECKKGTPECHLKPSVHHLVVQIQRCTPLDCALFWLAMYVCIYGVLPTIQTAHWMVSKPCWVFVLLYCLFDCEAIMTIYSSYKSNWARSCRCNVSGTPNLWMLFLLKKVRDESCLHLITCILNIKRFLWVRSDSNEIFFIDSSITLIRQNLKKTSFFSNCLNINVDIVLCTGVAFQLKGGKWRSK